LAERLQDLAGECSTVVIALPRGGVPVGYEIARKLGVPLDVMIVRKLGVPFQPELAMGAIASGDVVLLNEDVIRNLSIGQETIERAAEAERIELSRREGSYRGSREPIGVEGKTAILVDDGIATGATVRASVRALRQRQPDRIVIAVPVAPPETVARLEQSADHVVCLSTPPAMMAISMWYDAFPQMTDDQVRDFLRRAGTPEIRNETSPPPGDDPSPAPR
jgi:putative phosphoribosyl transferase